jgi:hypothetical protein
MVTVNKKIIKNMLIFYRLSKIRNVLLSLNFIKKLLIFVYIYSLHIFFTYILYIYFLHIFFTYIFYIYSLHIFYFLHIFFTYIFYIYSLHIFLCYKLIPTILQFQIA